MTGGDGVVEGEREKGDGNGDGGARRRGGGEKETSQPDRAHIPVGHAIIRAEMNNTNTNTN